MIFFEGLLLFFCQGIAGGVMIWGECCCRGFGGTVVSWGDGFLNVSG